MKIYTDPRTGMKYADYRLSGRRRRLSLRTKNNQVAVLKAAKLVEEYENGNSPQTPFLGFLEKYRGYILVNLSRNSIKLFEYAVAKLTAFKPVKYISEITPSCLEDFKASLKESRLSAVSVNNILAMIKSMMYYAERQKLLPARPWKIVKKLRAPKGRVEFHSQSELETILKNCRGKRWRLVVLLGARAGLRAGEINALKWRDVDLERKQIYIAPAKTENFRFIPLSKDLYNALKAVKERAADDFVIGALHAAQTVTLCAAYCYWTKDLGLHCHLHKLRHTFASHLAQAGVDLYRIAKLLGHTSVRMTEIYAHLSPSDLPGAVEKLPEI